MTDVRSLERTLLDNLPWNKARAKFVAAVYRSVGIQVVWIVLSKSGASDTSERTAVMEIFLDLFGAQNIACLLGDCEFVGREWFRFLKKHRIKFQMRPHKNRLVRNGRGQYEIRL
jgi:hypothetical protein